jgi:hypothetical protein
MISFRDYLTEPPKILCGIARNQPLKQLQLLEDLHVDPYTFIIPKEHEADYPGEVHAPGIVKVTKFGTGTKYYAHREIGKSPIEFSDSTAADKFVSARGKKHDQILNEIHDKLMIHYRHAHDKYGVHLSTYGRGSSNLNHSLMYPEKGKSVPEQALKLDHALSHTHTPDNLIVYSGISSDHAAKIRSNDVVHHPAFLSTSLRLSTAQFFSGSHYSRDVLKIHVPANHRGVYIGDVSGPNYIEREFLLPRGLKLRIHRDKEMIAKTQQGDYRIHHATIES